jgi:hypothetical protein
MMHRAATRALPQGSPFDLSRFRYDNFHRQGHPGNSESIISAKYQLSAVDRLR